ncbi:MAG: peptidase M23, partial [Gammaproteobacteria bacterium]
PAAINWQETTIASGDNLTTVFKRLGLNATDVYSVANTSTEPKALRRLRPGEHIAIYLSEEGKLAQVKYTRSTLEHYLYERGDNGFEGTKVVLKPDLIPTYKTAIINNSLSLDANRAGLSQAKIMELANIFGWDIDFALDIRKGDAFSVLYDEKFLNGEKVGNGDILAATFSNHGTTFSAVRYIEKDGSINYYTPDGKPMRKAFLRAPLDFTRISSNFSLHRKHPVHKRIKAHRGVDYAAPRGTPVYAAGDGRVVASGYSKANGNYVFIQHGGKYVTKYLHLTKRLTRKGKHVSQGKTIGTVGSTGYATGPHLHYEFLVNGVHRNPRTVKLPDAKTIAKSQRDEFIVQTVPLLDQLNQRNGMLIAQVNLHD